MASITLSGTLLDPGGFFAIGDKIRFTHETNTGKVVKSSITEITIPTSGSYLIELQYGMVRIDYQDVKSSTYTRIGSVTVNQDNPATNLPELLNAAVPPSSQEMIEFQAILADCVEQANNAAQSATEASQSATDAAQSAVDAANEVARIDVENTINPRYSDQYNYTKGTVITGSDGVQYRCLQDNGPNTTVVNPVLESVDRQYWQNTTKQNLLLDVNKRPPTRLDNKGFIGNQVWSSDGDIYVSNRISAGNWVTWYKDTRRYTRNPEPGRQPAACWWSKRVIESYTGPCFNITHEDLGTSIDIGFDYKGDLDYEAMAEFLFQSKGLINTWYDQSGNGNHLTSSGINRPIISSTKNVGDCFSVIFENSVTYNGSQIPEQFLEIPQTLSGVSDNLSFFILCDLASTARNCPLIELSGSDGKYTAIGKRSQNGVDSMAIYQNSSLRLITNHQPKVNENVFFTSISSTSCDYGANDNVSISGSSTVGVTFSGGKIGTTTNLFVAGNGTPRNGGALISGIIIHNSPTTEGTKRNVYKSIVINDKLTPQYNANLIFDGDSITEGATASQFDSYPRQLSESLSNGANVYQVGISGGTTTTQNVGRSKWQSKIYNASAPCNIITYAIGTNDIGVGTSVQTIYDNIVDYINEVTTVGYEIVLCTVLPRTSFTGTPKEADRLQLNQLLRDNWVDLGCIGFVDYDNEGTMGKTAFTSNLAYYADGTHPTTLGYSLMAMFVKETLEPLLVNRLLAD